MKDTMRIALLISGEGTTAAEIVRATKGGRLDASIACVIASRPDAPGIQRVSEEGIRRDRIYVLRREDFNGSDEKFGEVMISICRARGADILGQYGWMVKTPSNVIEAYQNRMINQHPGPLDPGFPDFGGAGMYGRRVHCARLWYIQQTGEEWWTEATAHRVAAEYDTGARLHARALQVHPEEDADSLKKRLLPLEHEVQVETLRDFARNTVWELPPRTERLVSSERAPLLQEAKEIARKQFPQG